MKISTLDVRDVIMDIMLECGFPPEELSDYERSTKHFVGVMGHPINENMKWKQIEQLIMTLCLPAEGYEENPQGNFGGLMSFGYNYANMVDVMRIANDELKEMYKN